MTLARSESSSEQSEGMYSEAGEGSGTMCQGYLQREIFFIERALVFRL